MEPFIQKRKEEPPLLFVSTILLSLIGGVLGIILFGAGVVFFNEAREWVTSVTNTTSMNGVTRLYFGLFAGLSLLSCIGAIKMKNWQQTGFFLYIIAQLLMLFLPVFWFDWNSFSVINAIFTAIFLTIYYFYSRQMA